MALIYLYTEGSMEGRIIKEFHLGERAEIIKAEDNLTVEGHFAQREKNVWRKGEQSQLVHQNDNLKVEGRLNTFYVFY